MVAATRQGQGLEKAALTENTSRLRLYVCVYYPESRSMIVIDGWLCCCCRLFAAKTARTEKSLRITPATDIINSSPMQEKRMKHFANVTWRWFPPWKHWKLTVGLFSTVTSVTTSHFLLPLQRYFFVFFVFLRFHQQNRIWIHLSPWTHSFNNFNYHHRCGRKTCVANRHNRCGRMTCKAKKVWVFSMLVSLSLTIHVSISVLLCLECSILCSICSTVTESSARQVFWQSDSYDFRTT